MTIRPLHQQYIVKKAAEGNPDPAIYCPANGYVDETLYIPNPLLPADGWNLLCEFQTNSPNTTTFDPGIAASSGQYAWDLGDGTIIIGDKGVAHTYLTTATRTVKLYGKGTCIITSLDFNTDNIVGVLDISNTAFAALSTVYLAVNPAMTGVVFPSSITGILSAMQIANCNLTGVLNLSGLTKLAANASIQLGVNPNLTGVTLASAITQGTIQTFNVNQCNITGTLNLSAFTALGTTTGFALNNNPLLTGVTFASTVTGTLYSLGIYSTGITGTLNLSMFKNFHSSSAELHLNSNPSLTGITFSSTTVTGQVAIFDIYSTGITGTLDLSKFAALPTYTTFNLYSNPSMTGVTFAPTITGTLTFMNLYSTGIVGTLDLSMFKTFHATATALNLYSNPSMTGILFSSTTVNGFPKTIRIDSNASLGYVNLSTMRTGIASLSWSMQNCNWSAAIVNQILSEINAISAAGFASRLINIGGNNVDPDTTSGGFDGVAARTALQGKSFTVTIT